MGFMRIKMEHRRRFFRVRLGSIGLLRLATFLLARPYDEAGRYAGEMGGGEKVLGGP
jgi:hypothetical protein